MSECAVDVAARPSTKETLPMTRSPAADQVRRILGLARNAVITTGYEYWLRQRAASGWSLPGRQHLDPVEMKNFLPHVVLIDVVREGPRYRFRNRLNGSHVTTEIFGRDGTGKYIEHTGHLEIFHELYRRFSTVVDDKALVYGISRAPAATDFMEYEHLTLPLASDGQVVDMLFGVRCALPYSDQAPELRDTVVPGVDRVEDPRS